MERGARRRGPAFRRAAIGMLAGVLATAACPSRDRPAPTILLFVLDTVRADAVAPDGGPPTATPTLTRLAATGLVYENAYATSAWTLPSHGSLFTGVLPSAHGIGVDRLQPRDDATMLAERLQRRGYQTIAVSENRWIGKELGFRRGFDAFHDVRFHQPVDQFAATLGEVLADRDVDRPLFLFVNVMDAHGPYLACGPSGTDETRRSVARSTPPGPATIVCSASPTCRR